MGVLNREFLKKLRLEDNMIAIVDMEAGIEHFGRGIDEGIDSVLLMVEPSFESLEIADRIQKLAVGMQKSIAAVLSKVPCLYGHRRCAKRNYAGCGSHRG